MDVNTHENCLRARDGEILPRYEPHGKEIGMKTGENIPLEKTIVENIVKQLRADGVRFIVKTHGAAFQRSGLPDLLLIEPKTGRFVGLEVKRPGVGKVTALQESMLKRINEAGGFACVVRDVDEARLAVDMAGRGYKAVV